MSIQDYKFVPHGPWEKGSYKTYCINCGLVRLNNAFTDWALRMGCNNRDHTNYENERKKAGK